MATMESGRIIGSYGNHLMDSRLSTSCGVASRAFDIAGCIVTCITRVPPCLAPDTHLYMLCKNLNLKNPFKNVDLSATVETRYYNHIKVEGKFILLYGKREETVKFIYLYCIKTYIF